MKLQDVSVKKWIGILLVITFILVSTSFVVCYGGHPQCADYTISFLWIPFVLVVIPFVVALAAIGGLKRGGYAESRYAKIGYNLILLGLISFGLLATPFSNIPPISWWLDFLWFGWGKFFLLGAIIACFVLRNKKEKEVSVSTPSVPSFYPPSPPKPVEQSPSPVSPPSATVPTSESPKPVPPAVQTPPPVPEVPKPPIVPPAFPPIPPIS